MKPIVFALSLCLGGVSAQAETVNLGNSGCGLARICYSVLNDAAPAPGIDGAPDTPVRIDLYAGPTSSRYALMIDGVVWTSQTSVGFGNTIAGMSFSDGASKLLTLSAVFTTFRTCTVSGRGQHCSTHYTLTGGTVVR